LAAIVLPGTPCNTQSFIGESRPLAGAIGSDCWKTDRMLATIGIGMVALWLLQISLERVDELISCNTVRLPIPS
jgi:hypothetical protein